MLIILPEHIIAQVSLLISTRLCDSVPDGCVYVTSDCVMNYRQWVEGSAPVHLWQIINVHRQTKPIEVCRSGMEKKKRQKEFIDPKKMVILCQHFIIMLHHHAKSLAMNLLKIQTRYISHIYDFRLAFHFERERVCVCLCLCVCVTQRVVCASKWNNGKWWSNS